MKQLKKLTTLLVRDREFYIVKIDDYYCAIEDKYLDENGVVNQKLNGLQMHAEKTMEQCIKAVQDSVEIDYLMDNGYSMEQAFKAVFKIVAVEQIQSRASKRMFCFFII